MTTAARTRTGSTRDRWHDDLYTDVVAEAIDKHEISGKLTAVPGIDADFLRRRCAKEKDRLLADLSDDVPAFDLAASREHQLSNRTLVAKATRAVLTTPVLHRLLALSGLLSFVLAFLFYRPGPLDAHPHTIMLLASAALVAVGVVVTRVPDLAARVAPRWHEEAVAGLHAVAVLLFLSAIVWIAPVRQSSGKPGADQPGTFLSIAGICALFFLCAFIRVSRENKGELTTNPRVPFIILLGALLPLVITVLRARGDNGIAQGQPQWFFVAIGATLLALVMVITLCGLGAQPAQVLLSADAATKARVRRRLRDEAVLPLLREEINGMQPSFETTIEVTEAPGLSQLSDPMYKVPTRAAGQIADLFDTMPGGSIGLAGSRGAGKSTVIEAECERAPDTLATMVSAPVEYSGREFLLHLYAKVCLEVLGPAVDSAHGPDVVGTLGRRSRRWVTGVYGAVALVAGGILILLDTIGAKVPAQSGWGVALVVLAMGLFSQVVFRRDPARVPSSGVVPLVELAAARLEEIRFQQSFTATWSSAVKAPVGVEGTFGGGRGLTRQQMHLPEIVDSLRAFLERAARERQRVVIGIDELDKMRSEAAAEQLLNEIKGVFGVRGCYFLVSVSEDAMSSFERRGLPFRDVFDSTFDEIVWFEPLTPAEAVATIDRRVLLMPVPFKHLCYTLSGGLPRDLIRTARKVVDAQEPTGPTDLSTIAGKLVTQDVARKAHAIAIAARKLDHEPQIGLFLLECAGLRESAASAGQLRRRIKEMAPSAVGQGPLARLVEELTCYLYYAATVLEFFDTTAGPRPWTAGPPDAPGDLARLARAREAFAVSTRVAWESISRFRTAWAMEPDPYPAAVTIPSPR
ncbi:hypothetical protein CLV68_2636 [Actinokineospora cianjurensis]|uniref:KAP-like P-loop domain-containing protein n=1 Tax=Actinokineospora cianjurensis TaxID=585224 RepID=A0A421BCM0_9PSEU|nr:hypothetical protein CLV68_2636 [Actinokineospora cianjurensis]